MCLSPAVDPSLVASPTPRETRYKRRWPDCAQSCGTGSIVGVVASSRRVASWLGDTRGRKGIARIRHSEWHKHTAAGFGAD